MENKNTSLSFQQMYDYFGIAFETLINGKKYRGAVKIPTNSDDSYWIRAFIKLKLMLDEPTNESSGCVSGNAILTGNEVVLDNIEKTCKNCANRFIGHERMCYECNDYEGNPTYSEWEYKE